MSPDQLTALPLSFAQERLWFLDQLLPGSPAYTLVDAARLRGPLDVDALQSALTELVRRHEVLRSTFPAITGQPVQIVGPPILVPLPRTDLRETPAAHRDTALAEALAVEASRPIALTDPTMLRAHLFRLADDDHVLSLAVHHIAFDAWSDQLLRTELAALYASHRHGHGSPLPDLELQYADFAVWQRDWMSGPVLRSELDHWRAELADAPHLLHLPLDRPRPAVQTLRGRTHAFELDHDLTAAIRRLAADHGTTVFMTLLAGFQALLHRYSGQDTVLVGTPVANRGRVELEPMIGFFSNTVVMRADLTPTLTTVELLRQVRDRTLTALAHQDLPFERLVHDLAPEREPAHNPIFQAMFALNNADSAPLRLDGLDVSMWPVERDTAMLDLLLYVDEQPDGLHPLLQYNSDILDESTVARLARHYRRQLRAMVDDPARPVTRPNLLDGTERAQIDGWNRTATRYHADPAPAAQALIHEQAQRTPTAVALRFRDQELTYRDLDTRASRLAHHLRHLGVGTDSTVAICMERSLDLLVAVLAVLEAGAAYVPLDPDYPSQRLAYMLADASPPVVIAQSTLLDRLPDHDALLVCLDTVALPSDLPDTPPDTGLNPANLAYVIYTSGSTGRPKGVMVDHAGLTNRLAWMQDTYQLDASDRLLQKTPYSFDVSVWELLWPLTVGATLVLAEPGRHIDPRYIADLVQREAITTIHFVPSMLDAFLDEPHLPTRCATLRRVYCSGEALTPMLRDRFLTRLSAELHNEYGPTETGEITAAHCASPAAPLTIGRPIANTTAQVVDRWLNPTPIGVPGELLLGGVALARGYHGQPDLTADRYLPNPFDPAGGSRLYRTGDLCRWLPDGTLDYLGRADDQLKIRGFRIEPAEIEAALLSHPAIRQAAIIARRDDSAADLRLVAYLTSDGIPPAAADLRAHLAARLPAHLLPSAYVVVPSLPLTPSGKLDRRALPAPEPTPATTIDPPRTPTEERLVAIWSEVLGLGRIGIHDSFFDLGGHSLLAIRVVARIRELLRADLPLRAMFEQPTIAALAGRLETLTDTAAIPTRPDPDSPQPLSPAQSRMWFLDRLLPDSAAYSIVDARLLTGPLDRTALAVALSALVDRHHALRSPVTVTAGSPHQVLGPPEPVRLTVTDLDPRDLPKALHDEAAQPIPLDGPLLRARLWRLGDQQHALSLAVHHIAFDEWSLDVFQAELSVLYAAFRRGEPNPLPPPGLQYGDYAAWQRNRLDNGGLRPQLDYWLTELADAPEALELPTDRPRPATWSGRGSRLGFTLDPALAAGLADLARRHDATQFMIYLAAFQAVLHRVTAQPTVLVGTPIANRDHLELEHVVGLFANTLVLRADFDADPSFSALLQQVRGRALSAYTHQDLPYERLVEELAPNRDASHNPVFQVMFAFQTIDPGRLQLDDITTTPLEVENGTSKLDLTLDVYSLGVDTVQFELEYSTDLFDPDTITRFAGLLRQLLAAVVGAPDQPLARLPLLSAEQQADERAWSIGAQGAPYRRPVHELVAEQIQRSPNSPAVRWEGGELTYADLDTQATLLAQVLSRHGARPETVVATCLPRGARLVVAELGILRAGAAYLPLDPDNPAVRLAYMCDDASALLVVTDQANAHRVPAGLPTLMLDAGQDLDPSQDRGAPTGPPPTVHPASLAYVIYTSGSTGRPKGVMVEHRSLANVVAWRTARAGLGPTDRTAMVASPGFDASVTDVWPALISGACIWVPDQETRLTPTRLQAWLLDHRITVTEVPTPLAELLLDLPWPATSSLRLLITGGDRLHRRPHPTVTFPLLNEYGPTENTATSTAGEVRSATTDPTGDPAAAGLPSIGRPIAGTTGHIVDGWLQPRPLGSPGELLLGGVGVTRGYLGRPDLTAERFLPDPFATEPGSRLYVSGDAVRRRPDGDLDFLGRTDRQVKIRGFRIELGEVTAALRGHPQVADAWVTAPEGAQPGSRYLAAYIVAAHRQPAPTPEQLRAHLARNLPVHMVPSAYVTLPALPLNRSGKVDQQALPAPQPRSPAHQLVAPTTEREARLVEIWREVLGVDQVSVDDSFFDLGGHSLLLAQVHARLQAELTKPLPMVKLFEHPTIRTLARHLVERPAPAGPTPAATRLDRTQTDPTQTDPTQTDPTQTDLGARLRVGRSRLARRAQLAPTPPGGDRHVR